MLIIWLVFQPDDFGAPNKTKQTRNVKWKLWTKQTLTGITKRPVMFMQPQITHSNAHTLKNIKNTLLFPSKAATLPEKNLIHIFSKFCSGRRHPSFHR